MKKIHLLSLLTVIGLGAMAGFLFAHSALAVTLTADQMFGGSGETFASTAGLASGSLVLMIAGAIRTFLGFLGIVALIVVLYAGFLWTTAGGEEVKVLKAKKILKNGVIGLLIILSSFAIAQFVLSKITGAAGDVTCVGDGCETCVGADCYPYPGPDYAHHFVLTGFNDECASSLQNLQMRFTFSQSVVVEDITGGNGIFITKQVVDPDGEMIDQTVSGTFETVPSTATSATSFTFTPTATCDVYGDASVSVHCFDPETTYNVSINTALKSTSGYEFECTMDNECEFTITTGTGFDLTPPHDFSITDPRVKTYAGSALLQARGIDDTGIASVSFYIDRAIESTVMDGESGDEYYYYFNSEWNTEGYITNHSYNIYAEGADCAGNSVSDDVNVMLQVVECNDGVQNNDETGSCDGLEPCDCGGDSTSEFYCGACVGSECYDDYDCASGSCVEGVCVATVEIFEVSPGDGTEGNLITISGKGFGSDVEGTITFLGSAGESEVTVQDYSACGEASWSDSEVIISIPTDATDGPIKILNSNNSKFDQTDDENGKHINDFDINDTVRPGICSLDPEPGESGGKTIVSGRNFGTGEKATFYFDTYAATGYENWTETLFNAFLPALDAGTYTVQLFTGAGDSREGSNKLSYSVTSTIDTEMPVISQVDPDLGPISQYVTIRGSNFGTNTGTVWFKNQNTLYEALGDTSFPVQCESVFWSNDEIIIKVPSKYSNDTDIETSLHDLYVKKGAGSTLVSAPVDFTVTTGEASPGLCAIVPDSGPAETTGVVLYGQGFENTPGSIAFFQAALPVTSSSWFDTVIGIAETNPVFVPKDAASGPVIITDADGQKSNSINFTVGFCDVDFSCDEGDSCCADGTCLASCPTFTEPVSHYAYYFSTGDIPDTPDVRIECSDDWISPTPWEGWEGGTDVCPNATLTISFTETMDESSYSTSGFSVKKCSDAVCTTIGDSVSMDIKEESDSTTLISKPTSSTGWDPGTRYFVTVNGGTDGTIKGEGINGLAMLEDVSWYFTTSTSGEPCKIGGVIVNPGDYTSNEQGEAIPYGAQPIDSEYQCETLDCDPYTWNFSSSDSGKASVNPASPVGSCATTVTALEETTSGQVAITATPSGYLDLHDEGLLTITFTDPEITDYAPNCSEACTDAAIFAHFNISMAGVGTFNVREIDGLTKRVRLFKCLDPGCAPDELTAISSAVSYSEATPDEGPYTLTIVPRDGLVADTSYRVVISGEAESASGSTLSETAGDLDWYGDKSWTFSTKSETCVVDRVEIEPAEALATYVGAIQRFTAVPYGAPDACSAEGQRLVASGYTWDRWVANDEYDVDMVELEDEGTILISSVLPEGCSSNCLYIGTTTLLAVCGDGKVGDGLGHNNGEDCDGGEGCSATCLHEGSTTTCGDGLPLDVGEECDDGNTTNGDGCSSICLNEGAAVLHYDCTDGKVAHSDQIGGEECDSAEEGCSGNCLHEGSEPLTDFTSGVCGNGLRDVGEDCDGGEGCSGNCLHEGSSSSYTAPSTCGRNGVETGEDCDDSNTINGDGCSSICLREGSSDAYGSLCGNGGTPETGEECEAAEPIEDTAPFTIAQITEEAPQAVTESGLSYAVSIITGQESESHAKGDAKYTLQCSCETDSNCDITGVAYGCGDANCCFERPTILSNYPVQDARDVCRNTEINVKFSQKMNIDGLDDSGTLILQYVAKDVVISESDSSIESSTPIVETNCPSAYTTIKLAEKTSDNFFARVWEWLATHVLRIFGAQAADPVFKACIVPVSYTQAVSGTVELDLTNVLDPGEYKLIAVGETDTNPLTESVGDPFNGVVDGVASTNGVAIYEGTSVDFVVGTEICALEMVTVEDLGKPLDTLDTFEDPSPYLFTESGEVHNLEAAAYTLNGASAEKIQSTTEYSWAWSWGDEDGVPAIIDVTPSTTTTTTAVASTTEGDELALATAQIYTEDSDDEEEKITGSANLTAFFCESLWPTTGAFPYLEEYSNFSFFYCLDKEDGTLLPELTPITPPASPSGVEMLRERLFLVVGTSDAIGVRVFANEGYLTPAAWFAAQDFTGSPSETTLDGYEAVRVGNTYYVSAVNYSPTGKIDYPNIYVISFNEDADEDTENIVGQILENWSFNAGLDINSDLEVSDFNLCLLGSTYVQNTDGDYISCESDLDCASTVCDAKKGKLRRNLTRLTDAKTIVSALADYGETNRHCSVTKGQSCEADSDCPSSTETCLAEVPEIQSGTFLSAFSTSTWPSWNAELGNALGTALPTDPLNKFYCPDYADQDYCWNSVAGTFSCKDGSHAYLYQSLGGEGYILSVQLENAPGDYWAYPIDDATTDGMIVYAEFAGKTVTSTGFIESSNFCNGVPLGTSARCGDGVKSLSGEACELGQTDPIVCDSDTGTMAAPCLSDCSGYMSETQAETAGGICTPYECGNGVTDPGETCDDGANNGDYGYCDEDCGLAGAWYCGDGYLAGGEECDCYSTVNWPSTYPTVALPAASWAGINDCKAANGQYNNDPTGSCAFDCSYPGPSCGDGEVNGGEQCDGDSIVWSGALCSDNETCSVDSDCSSGSCGGTATTNACPISTVCDGGTYDGESCLTGCTDGICDETFEYQLSRTRICDDDDSSPTCNWNTWTACLGGEQICGNGIIEGDETCDDGNTDNSDDCTEWCALNFCGDDAVYAGHETCDNGTENGTVCTPEYGETCNYCNINCQYSTTSGAYCGDGTAQTGEFCDGADLPKYCYLADANPETRAVSSTTCENKSDCPNGMLGAYACLEQVGVCNGGSRALIDSRTLYVSDYYDYNGAPCVAGTDYSSSYDCGSTLTDGSTTEGTCMVADCGATCSETCPFTYNSAAVSIETELPGAGKETSAALYSYNSGNSPDIASIYLPACSVGTSLTADINISSIDPPTVDIVFVVDLSSSMDDPFDGSSGIEVLVASLSEAIKDLFNAYEDYSNLQIGLVGYTTNPDAGDGATVCEVGASAGSTQAWMFYNFSTSTSESNLLYGETGVASFVDRVFNFGGGTTTAAGLECARRMFGSSSADSKIIVLMSDGDATMRIDPAGVSLLQEIQNIRDTAIANEIQIYTAALTSSNTLIGNMAHWSSDTCTGDPDTPDYDDAAMCSLTDSLEYAYSANTAEGLNTMYQQIADSIVGITTTFTTNFGGGTVLTQGTVTSGDDVTLQFPSGFLCDPLIESSIPFRVTFGGEGTLGISDIKLSYCPSSSASAGSGVTSTVDSDGDGVRDFDDNCPSDANPILAGSAVQTDFDSDGIGDICDLDEAAAAPELDTDSDGIPDSEDNCKDVKNGPDDATNQTNSDTDILGDACDNCPNDYNPDQLDTDLGGAGDGVGDLCDTAVCNDDNWDAGEYCDTTIDVYSSDALTYCVTYGEVDPAARQIYNCGTGYDYCSCETGFLKLIAGHVGICDSGSGRGYDYTGAICSPLYPESSTLSCGESGSRGDCTENTCDSNCLGDSMSDYLLVCGDNNINLPDEICDGSDLPVYCVKGGTNPENRDVKLMLDCDNFSTCDCSSFGTDYNAVDGTSVGICNGGTSWSAVLGAFYFNNYLCSRTDTSGNWNCGGGWGGSAGSCVADVCTDCASTSVGDLDTD